MSKISFYIEDGEGRERCVTLWSGSRRDPHVHKINVYIDLGTVHTLLFQGAYGTTPLELEPALWMAKLAIEIIDLAPRVSIIHLRQFIEQEIYCSERNLISPIDNTTT